MPSQRAEPLSQLLCQTTIPKMLDGLTSVQLFVTGASTCYESFKTPLLSPKRSVLTPA